MALDQIPKFIWLVPYDQIPDQTTREAVVNARLLFPDNLDSSAVDRLLIKLDEVLNKTREEFPYETDLEKTLRREKFLSENGLPLKNALALLVLREVKLGNYGAAVKASEAYDANFGKKTRDQRKKFGKDSHKDEQDEIKEDRQKYQELANQHWKKNVRLSIRQIASLIHKELEAMSESERPCRIKSERTIRTYIKKP